MCTSRPWKIFLSMASRALVASSGSMKVTYPYPFDWWVSRSRTRWTAEMSPNGAKNARRSSPVLA